MFFMSFGMLSAQQPPVFNYSNTQFVAEQQVSNSVDIKIADWNKLLENVNGSWDISGFPLTGNFQNYDYVNSSNPLFPNSIAMEFAEQSTPNTIVYRTSYFTSNETGMHEIGTSFKEQRYPIGQFTQNVLDTFYLLNQEYEYVTPRTIMKFPCTMNSAWGSGYSVDFNTELTITNFGLNRAPFVRNTLVAQYDSVIGWGQMRVPMADGKKSILYPTLVISRSSIVRHLYTLNGQPAPPTLLAAFGLSQNDSSASTSSLLFWRGGTQRPLVHAMFDGYSLDLTKYIGTSVDTKNLEEDAASSVSDEFRTTASVSPNPVTGNAITLTLNNDFSGGQMDLYNSFGERVTLPTFYVVGTQTLILNTDELNSGTYTIRLHDKSGTLITSSFVVVR